MRVISTAVSSLTIVPLAATTWMRSPKTVNANRSSNSFTVSPATLTVIVFEVSPTANVSEPAGRTPDSKSAAFAGSGPEPSAFQPIVSDVFSAVDRVTLNT